MVLMMVVVLLRVVAVVKNGGIHGNLFDMPFTTIAKMQCLAHIPRLARGACLRNAVPRRLTPAAACDRGLRL